MMEHCFPECPEHIQVGQIWMEVDPRFARFVKVESIATGGREITIRTVVKDSGQWVNAPRSRKTYADHSRFNGKRGGYVLHAHAPGGTI